MTDWRSSANAVLAIGVGLLLVAGACRGDSASGGHAHGGGHDHGSSGHDHGGEAAAGVQRVGWASGLEAFVESAPLVRGEETTLTVHLSVVDGYVPVDGGTVEVVLTGPDAPGERFPAEPGERAGIFEASVRPEHAVERTLFVVHRGGEEAVRIALGTVEVHREHPEEQEPSHARASGVAFSKEQQWSVDFATAEVRRRELESTVRARAHVRAAPDADTRIRAPLPGRLRAPSEGLPEVGDVLEAGDRYAVLAPTVDANARPVLRGDVAQARTELDRVRREVERLKSLVDEGAVPEKRLLDARSRRRGAKAKLQAAERRLRQYRSFESGGGSAGMILRAPSSGTVVEKRASDGEFVDRGESVARLVDRTRLRLQVRVSESRLGELDRVSGVWFRTRTGMEVELSREGSFIARSPEVDPKSRTVDFWFELASPPPELAPGAFQRVRLRTGRRREGPAVPRSALLEEKGLWVVYVAVGPETFERRRVRRGVRAGDLVEVERGLAAGERVVTRGAYLVDLASATTGVGSHSH